MKKSKHTINGGPNNDDEDCNSWTGLPKEEHLLELFQKVAL